MQLSKTWTLYMNWNKNNSEKTKRHKHSLVEAKNSDKRTFNRHKSAILRKWLFRRKTSDSLDFVTLQIGKIYL